MNRKFLPHYAGALDQANVRAVYFSPHAFELKKLKPFTEAEIREGFQNTNLSILNSPEALIGFIRQQVTKPANILLMSSGNFDNANFDEIPLLN
jgi:UDP-N-acetylmuramate: L-alanyl-gamma-D-glutamyl-meso-diaminopimelate ligase